MDRSLDRREALGLASSRRFGLAGPSTPLMWTASLAAIGVVIGLWWLLAAAVFKNPTLLPTPAQVVAEFGSLLTARGGSLQLWPNVVASLIRVCVGLASGVAVGILIGALMASNRWVMAAIDPLVQLGRPIPPLAFAPLFVIWFGIGETPKDLILFFSVVPIIIIATAASIRGVDESMRRAAMSLGASRLYTMRRVILPSALPTILTAVRISSGVCWSTLIAAEIIASTSGLGWMILQAGNYLDTSTVFVGIVMIGLLALLMDRGFLVLERVLVPWRGKS